MNLYLGIDYLSCATTKISSSGWSGVQVTLVCDKSPFHSLSFLKYKLSHRGQYGKILADYRLTPKYH